MAWALDVDLRRDRAAPLFASIARAIARDIARGRLKPGQRLPGQRSLAANLGVHRNTIVAAYEELVSGGWATAHPARATVVSDTIPKSLRRRGGTTNTLASQTRYAIASAKRRGGPSDVDAPFQIQGGVPDPRLAPKTLIARALGRVLRRPGVDLLAYGDPRGHHRLRAQLALLLSETRGIAASQDDLVLTQGSQMALYLLAHAIVAPGDTVAVESPGYAPAWDAFESAGARLRPIPVDRHGLVVDRLIEGTPPRAVYITPHHQYPTTVTLSADRRLRLLAWAARCRVAIIEDDYDNEYHFDGRPVLPLIASDTRGCVAYVGTLSKVIAPGLRIGWVVAPSNLLQQIAALRGTIDTQGALPTEAAIAELLEDGELQRHIWRMKRVYAARRDALAEALERRLGKVLAFDVPRGGMALWAHVDPSVDVDGWATAARARGVVVGADRRYNLRGRSSPNLRIGFARHDPVELEEAVTRLAAALHDCEQR